MRLKNSGHLHAGCPPRNVIQEKLRVLLTWKATNYAQEEIQKKSEILGISYANYTSGLSIFVACSGN
jgi:hypothetical protein